MGRCRPSGPRPADRARPVRQSGLPMDIKYYTTADGLDLPESWVVNNYHHSGRLLTSWECKRPKSSNPQFGTMDFRFPPSWYPVFDFTAGKRKDYLIKPDGSKRTYYLKSFRRRSTSLLDGRGRRLRPRVGVCGRWCSPRHRRDRTDRVRRLPGCAQPAGPGMVGRLTAEDRSRVKGTT